MDGMRLDMARNKFKYLLGVDFETTGVCIRNEDPLLNTDTGERHQAISGGFLVIEEESLEVVDRLYVEIQWNEESKRQRELDSTFGVYAESIHGLTYDHLEANGVTEEEAIENIGGLILDYWANSSPINLMGHNVAFDRRFLFDLFIRHGCYLNISARSVDSFSVGLIAWGLHNSDELFDVVVGKQRTLHSAMEDIEFTLEAMKTTRKLFNKFLNEHK